MSIEKEIGSFMTGIALTEEFCNKSDEERYKFFHDAFFNFFNEGMECIDNPGIYEIKLQIIRRK